MVFYGKKSYYYRFRSFSGNLVQVGIKRTIAVLTSRIQRRFYKPPLILPRSPQAAKDCSAHFDELDYFGGFRGQGNQCAP